MTTLALHPPNRLTALPNARPQADGLRRLLPTRYRTTWASQQRKVAISDQDCGAILIANSSRSAHCSNASRQSRAGQIPIARRVS